MHALLRKDLRWYADWLASSEQADGRQFITVLGSHDGMGMKPLRGLLPEAEIQAFAQYLSTERGGIPNFARLPGGSEIVYEVCGTAWELINGGSTDPFEQQLARYRVVVALGMMSRGVPALYLQAVLGASNHFPEAGLDENRTVNRERFAREDLQLALSANDSRTSAVVEMITHLLEVRSSLKVFDARCSSLRIHSLEDPRVLAVSRSKKRSELTMVVNVSAENVRICSLTLPAKRYQELLSGEVLIPERDPSDAAPAKIELAGYGVHWLVPCEE